MQELKDTLKQACQTIFGVDIEPELTRPEERFGDYATNVALQLAKDLSDNPREIAQKLVSSVESPSFKKVEVAGAGFINFTLSDEALLKSISNLSPAKPYADQQILVEFGDPNPFKEMHIGHLYSSIVGDAISGLLEIAGAEVERLSYHGDIGLHVARAIWGMRQLDGDFTPANIGEAYARGAKAYTEDKKAKSEIDEINQQVYGGSNSTINELYAKGRKASFSNFDRIYQKLGINYDKRYLESQVADVGLKFVKDNIGDVFKESQGAVVFEGESVGLHTRVFITSKGLPTYETKDLGLTEAKNKDYPNAHRSIVITANEQKDYFKVMLAALAQIDKKLADRTTHLSHGFLSLSSGKMSSRTGDVYTASRLLTEVEDAVAQQYPDSEIKEEVALAALKYAFLNHRVGHDLVFNVNESISLNGNSGPYIQYAHARAQSILVKAGKTGGARITNLDPSERSLARKVSEYPEAIQRANDELMPHHLCNYLYELTQAFNRFYEQSRIIGDNRESTRLTLLVAHKQVLKNGLDILKIATPDKM